MSWAAAVKRLRLARGWTQADVARATGGEITVGTIGNFERGRHENPTEKMQRRLAQAFGITVADLHQEAGLEESVTADSPAVGGSPPEAQELARILQDL